jgi:hypothetical protein
MSRPSAKTYHAIIDPNTEMFWRGNLPGAGGGARGKLSSRVIRWKPKMDAEPTSWAREVSAIKKLSEYDLLRVVRPELPKLRVQSFAVKPIVIGEWEPGDLEERVVLYSRLYHLFGSTIADDWHHLKGYDYPEHRFLVRLSTRKDCLTKIQVHRHFPDAPARNSTVLLTEDDLVLLRLAAPKAESIALDKIGPAT